MNQPAKQLLWFVMEVNKLKTCTGLPSYQLPATFYTLVLHINYSLVESNAKTYSTVVVTSETHYRDFINAGY